ncbi:Cyclin CCL1 [Erysiphe neolycopersici]|uniref:Cyclin CCL1 n=1 Tax=Erysiphe neolycopersici TaxID=212602 RepID=A0A420I1U2_9PEZI|nr:Cyclin CCL1 [Erysiphe neolycopersici]
MSNEKILTEDERYRMSSQFRLWSFSPQTLYELRRVTNKTAADRVRDAFRRARAAQNPAGETEETAVTLKKEQDVEYLTVEEELKLLAFYCRQTLQLGDHLNLPSDVKATTIQFLKRFYITNSLMTYHPTDILKTALFFATKTENFYFHLTKFADAIGKTKAEDVLASEFLLTQGLRFTFDVRHPYRALEGAIMELHAISKKEIPLLPGKVEITTERPKNLERRVKDAHGRAREYLKSSSLLTDAYFHFTPSQIMMAALVNADKDLAMWYLEKKLPETEDIKRKILSTIDACANMLKIVNPHAEPLTDERKELQALAKKLKKCRNPEKIDLVSLQRAKREGDEGYGEKVIKKRKLEGQNSTKVDDVFGPKISVP